MWPIATCTYGRESWALQENEETSWGLWNERTEKNPTCLLSKENKWVGSKRNWDNTGIVRLCKGKEASILWSHREETRELPGKKRLCKEQSPVDVGEEDYVYGLDKQHQQVDQTYRGGISQNDKRQRSKEKIRPWYDQPLDRGWLMDWAEPRLETNDLNLNLTVKTMRAW